MKRKVDWDEEEESDYEDSNASGNEESDNEEPRIKEILEGLSQLVSRQMASNLLHSMAASKDVLFWTPRGQLLRNQRIIPVTNISELVEYVLLTQNNDVVKPRALKTLIGGFAELGIDKRLIQNKRILAELLDKEQVYRDKDSEAGDKEITVSESSDSEDDTETASEISEQEESENPDLEPKEIHRFCLKAKVFASIATERTFTKEKESNALDVFGMMFIGFVPYVHIKFLLIVNT